MKIKYEVSFVFKGETFPSIESFRRMTIMNPEKWERCFKEYVNIVVRIPSTKSIEFLLKTQIIKLAHQTEEEIYEKVMELAKNDREPKETFEVRSIDRLLDLQKVDCDVTCLYLWVQTMIKKGKVSSIPCSDDRVSKIASYIESLIDEIETLNTPKKNS